MNKCITGIAHDGDISVVTPIENFLTKALAMAMVAALGFVMSVASIANAFAEPPGSQSVKVPGAQGQGSRSGEVIQQVELSSGLLSNVTGEPQEHFIGTLKASGAARVRVRVSEGSLGAGGSVRFTSVKDGQSQRLDARQLQMWGHTSAMFNGEKVRVELYCRSS